jgi:hypothetical protein
MKHPFHDMLERIRDRDHEDNIKLCRHEIVMLVEEFNDLKQDLENTKYHLRDLLI